MPDDVAQDDHPLSLATIDEIVAELNRRGAPFVLGAITPPSDPCPKGSYAVHLHHGAPHLSFSLAYQLYNQLKALLDASIAPTPFDEDDDESEPT